VSAPHIEEIQQLVQRIVDSEGMELVDVEFKSGRSRNLVRVFIDKVGGVTLDDCENISRQLGAILDVKDLMKNAYILEISSPGVDRPMRTDRDYERSLGRTMRVTFHGQNGDSQQMIGRLLEVTDAAIVLDVEGKLTSIARDQIIKAVQEIVLGNPKKNQKKRK
jgi:ribosome maturation factor RimP